jgi:histidinol-phosphate aminotransferase
LGVAFSDQVTSFAATRRREDERLNFSSNELIHPDLPSIFAKLTADLAPDLWHRYPVVAGTATRMARYFGCEVDELLMTPGSDSALRLVCRYFARRTGGRGTVVLQHPNYLAWEQQARLLDVPIRAVSLDARGLGDQTRRLVAAASVADNCLIAVSVPNGPAGGALSGGELDTLTTIARERGHLLVIDSAYQAFHGGLTDHVARRGGPVLVVQSMSKSHGLAGARFAVLFGDPAVLAQLATEPLEHCVSGPALRAARFAADHHDLFAPIWTEIGQVRDRTADELRGEVTVPWPSGGNFLTIRVGTARTAAGVTRALSAAGVRVRDLSALPGLSGCVRFTIADAATTGTFQQLLRDTLQTAGEEARHAGP